MRRSRYNPRLARQKREQLGKTAESTSRRSTIFDVAFIMSFLKHFVMAFIAIDILLWAGLNIAWEMSVGTRNIERVLELQRLFFWLPWHYGNVWEWFGFRF